MLADTTQLGTEFHVRYWQLY